MAEPTFVDLLRRLRSDYDLSQRGLAEILGVSGGYMNDVEHGRRLPTVKMVTRICGYLWLHGPKARAWHYAGARAHGWDVKRW